MTGQSIPNPPEHRYKPGTAGNPNPSASNQPLLREQDNPECDNCGNELEREWDKRSCSNCGAPLPGWEPQSKAQSKKVLETARKSVVIFVCDGCGEQVESPSGFKPSDWYARTDKEPPWRQWHACSRSCIEKSPSPEKLVMPI